MRNGEASPEMSAKSQRLFGQICFVGGKTRGFAQDRQGPGRPLGPSAPWYLFNKGVLLRLSNMTDKSVHTIKSTVVRWPSGNSLKQSVF